MSEQPNRLQAAIDRVQEKVDQLPADSAKQALGGLSAKLTCTIDELVAYQDIKSQGQAAGIITLEEAQLVYDILGGEAPTVEKWNARSVAEKGCVTHLMWEITCSLGIGAGGRTKTRNR